MAIRSNILKLTFLLCVSAMCVLSQEPSQSDENLNFSYSKNPPANTSSNTAANSKVESRDPDPGKTVGTKDVEAGKVEADSKPKFESVAKMTREIANEESVKNLKPTETYKVGSGDVLFISLQNAKSNYYTVLNDGSIDYPLAGGFLSVSGMTVGEIEGLLRSEIQLYENPDVSVKIREFASHRIDVIGMAERTGKLFLQREAMPLYVIRAQAQAHSTADIAVIKREGEGEIVIDFSSPEYDEALVYPGDVIEFASSSLRAADNGFVYVGGNVEKVGRVSFLNGITLTQAIIAAGGVSEGKARNVILRRKNDKGFLESKTYKLSDIKKGKSIDPALEEGDLIEVGS